MIVHTSAWDIEIKVRDFPDLNLSSFEVTVSLRFVKTHGNWITAR
jgi:hypothetical protein